MPFLSALKQKVKGLICKQEYIVVDEYKEHVFWEIHRSNFTNAKESLKKITDVNFRNHAKETPLICICKIPPSHNLSSERERLLLVKYLLSNGAKMKKKDTSGKNAKMYARMNGLADIEILLQEEHYKRLLGNSLSGESLSGSDSWVK